MVLHRPALNRQLACLVLIGLLGGCISTTTTPAPAQRVVVIPAPPATAGGATPGHWQWDGAKYVWVTGQ